MTTSNDQLADKNMVTSEDLEVEFAITTNEIKQALNNNPSPIDVKSVVEQLQIISAVKDKNVPLLDRDMFENVTTVEKLWQKLSRFWSIVDYDVLRILLRIVECKRANEIFEEFLSRVDIKDTDLVLCYEVFKGQELMQPLLRIKIKADSYTHSIKREVEEVVSSKFNLEEHSLRFRGTRKDCIEVIYEISICYNVNLLDMSWLSLLLIVLLVFISMIWN